MKLSLVQLKVFRHEKLGYNGRRKSVKKKEVHPKSRLQPCGPMESVSGTDAEVNESTSSMSCFNEFETFADEVNGEIPEVDYRGRIQSEKSQSDLDDTASLSQASGIECFRVFICSAANLMKYTKTGSKFSCDSQLSAGGVITRLSAEVMSRQIVRSWQANTISGHCFVDIA
ncbi:uncharacterized protein LOC110059005 [Orbicella faveolata]|uniref:uncharacterized protein LOC110059004 n=1 Tax=Orbicella faveolata TaxID=48498 RepID=UPI0009E32E79|nr:uncharacterized protein LOC110059004 [Orbicella faveolata]XP_020621329.1 uncharacterized protein LOC110059005 [Orbicella faveolata]